jgi:hypothetical protein
MKTMKINGVDVAQGNVVKALEAMLNGASNEELREFDCHKFDAQFYEVRSEVMPIYYMVKKEFNCLVVWITHCGPTSFNDGDEVVQRQYHPLCILDKPRDDEYQDVCRDIVNGLIRQRLLNADSYAGFNEEE